MKELQDIEVPESFSGELECIITGKYRSKWYHKGVELKSNGKCTVTSTPWTSEPHVKDVTKEDQEEYSFVVMGKRPPVD